MDKETLLGKLKAGEVLTESLLHEVVNFVELQKGPKGDKGDTGEPGKDGAQGLKGDKGAPGVDGKDAKEITGAVLYKDTETKEITGGTLSFKDGTNVKFTIQDPVSE